MRGADARAVCVCVVLRRGWCTFGAFLVRRCVRRSIWTSPPAASATGCAPPDDVAPTHAHAHTRLHTYAAAAHTFAPTHSHVLICAAPLRLCPSLAVLPPRLQPLLRAGHHAAGFPPRGHVRGGAAGAVPGCAREGLMCTVCRRFCGKMILMRALCVCACLPLLPLPMLTCQAWRGCPRLGRSWRARCRARKQAAATDEPFLFFWVGMGQQTTSEQNEHTHTYNTRARAQQRRARRTHVAPQRAITHTGGQSRR
jgi:hypothetical protein